MQACIKHISIYLCIAVLTVLYSASAWATLNRCTDNPYLAVVKTCLCGEMTCQKGKYCADGNCTSHAVVNNPDDYDYKKVRKKLEQEELEKAGVQDNTRVVNKEIEVMKEIGPVEVVQTKCRVGDYYAEWEGSEKCFFCDLFIVFFNAVSDVAGESMNSFSKVMAKLTIVCFSLWIAITVLSFISSVETKDGRDLIVNIVNQSFVVLICFFILQGPGGAKTAFDWTISPIFNTGMTIAQASISTTFDNYHADSSNKKKTIGKEFGMNNGYMCTYWQNKVDGKGGIPKEIGVNIVCMIDLIQQRVARVAALGESAICWSWEEASFWIIPQWAYLITGILLWLSAILMIVSYPFMMLDAVVQFGIAAALLPVGVFLFAFKITRGYCRKIWDAFLNTMFNFLFLSLIVLLLTAALESVISDSMGTVKTLFENKGSMVDLLNKLGWAGVSSLKIVFIMLMIWAILPSVGDYASEFAGALGPNNIGQEIGGGIASTAGGFAKKASRPIMKGLGDAAKKVGSKLIGGARGGIRMGTQALRSVKYKQMAKRTKNGNVTQNQDGTTTYSYKSWLGRNKEVTVGGKQGPVFKTQYTTSGGNTKVKTSTQNVKITQTIDANGNVIRDKIKGKGNIGRDLINKETGAINKENMEAVMQQIGNDNDAKAAVVRKLAEDKFNGLTPMIRKSKKNISTRNVIPIKKDGKDVGYEVFETYKDGSKRVYKMEFDTNGRSIMKVQHINKSGKVMTLETDGVVNKKTVGKLDKNGNIKVKKSHSYVELTKHYKNASREEVARAGSLFSEDELKMAYSYSSKNPGENTDMLEFN